MKRLLTPIAICVTGAMLTACGPAAVKKESSAITADSVVVHYALHKLFALLLKRF